MLTQLAIGASLTVAVPPSGAVASIAIAPAAITADCSIDVSAALNAWIASVPDNSTLSFAPDGCYRIDRTLIVSKRTGLTFEGNNATFRQVTDGTDINHPRQARTRAGWLFLLSAQLTVRNLTTIGANPHAGLGDDAYVPKFEAQHAYQIQATHTMLMDHVAAYDTYGDFVFVGPGTVDLVVRNSTFARNGRQGWTITGTNITFENNSITDTRRATIDMEPSNPAWASQNIFIRHNDVGPGRLFFFSSVGAAAPMDNINIIGNRLHRKPFVILVAPPKGIRTNYHVIGNTSDVGTSGFGSSLVFSHVEGLEIRDNVVPLQWAHHLTGVGLRSSAHVRIIHNVFRGGKAPVMDHGENVDVSQSGNLVGPRPMAVAPATSVAGPTPIPTR